ncbi:MAG: phosphate acetyltransferase, partial [Lachnospiraceae bacterium]|nr:phosphate acetyltransferase [Lachnospiraceae bacterium]
KPENTIVSSCFIMTRERDGITESMCMGDCAINLHPTEDQLVEIMYESAECAKIFGIDPKVAFLSYSTLGSGKGDDVTLVANAAAKAKEKYPDMAIEGELQFDAAVSPEVAKTKAKGSKVAGQANVFVFPDINAGNIGYKIAQRCGDYEAFGPILLGLNAPINDLSRGCVADEVYAMAIITAALA